MEIYVKIYLISTLIETHYSLSVIRFLLRHCEVSNRHYNTVSLGIKYCMRCLIVTSIAVREQRSCDVGQISVSALPGIGLP